MEQFEQYYPPKPELIRKKRTGHISITLLSIAVFALTFYLIIDDYYFILLLLFALLLHEGGHFLFMKMFKYEQMSMLFIPFIGAMVTGRKKKYSQIQTALMIMAGPLPGIFLGFTLLAYQWLPNENISIQLGVMLVLLNALNLIPVEPLDGGQFVRALFLRKQELFQLVFTALISVVLVGIGAYYRSIILILFGLLVILRVKSKHKLYLIRKEINEDKIEYESNYEDLSDKAYYHIKRVVLNHNPSLQKIEEEFGMDDEVQQLFARQIDSVLYPPIKRDASLFFKLLMIGLWGVCIWLSVLSIISVDLKSVINAFQYR